MLSRWLTQAPFACTRHPVPPVCVWESLPFSFPGLNWDKELSENLDLGTLTWAVSPRFQKSQDEGEDVRMTCLVCCSSVCLLVSLLGCAVVTAAGQLNTTNPRPFWWFLFFYCSDEHGIQVAQLKWLQKQSLHAIFHALCLAKRVGWHPTDLSSSWKASEIQTFE